MAKAQRVRQREREYGSVEQERVDVEQIAQERRPGDAVRQPLGRGHVGGRRNQHGDWKCIEQRLERGRYIVRIRHRLLRPVFQVALVAWVASRNWDPAGIILLAAIPLARAGLGHRIGRLTRWKRSRAGADNLRPKRPQREGEHQKVVGESAHFC
jgi:hypothetical protein